MKRRIRSSEKLMKGRRRRRLRETDERKKERMGE